MLEFIKNRLKNNGELQQVRVIALFSLVGFLITFMMGLINIWGDNHTLTLSLFLMSLIYLMAFLSVKKNNLTLSAKISIYSLFSMMFYLVFTGGSAQTGPLWIFIVAPVSVYVLGLKQGLINLTIFLSLVCGIMFFPQDIIQHAQYTAEFKLRLILSFITMTFLSGLYEYSRMLSYQNALELSHKYQRLAMSDPLTKLANRRSALAVLQQEKSRFPRNNEPLSVLLCDLDHFKIINDKHGHNCGDMVLKALSQVFIDNVRQQDCVARWGGEEFLFILPQTSAAQAAIIAEKIRASVQDHTLECLKQQINVTISIGVSQLTQDQSIDELINNADKCLYQAKTLGRNRVYPSFETIIKSKL